MNIENLVNIKDLDFTKGKDISGTLFIYGGLIVSEDILLKKNLIIEGQATAMTMETTNSSSQIATTRFVKNQNYATLQSPFFSGIACVNTPQNAINKHQIINIEYLNQNLESIQSAITFIKTQNSFMQMQINDITRNFVTINTMLNQFQKKIDETVLHNLQISGNVTILDKKMDSYKSHIGLIGGNVTIVDRKMDSYKSHIGLIAGNVAILDKKMDTFKSHIGLIAGNVTILDRKMDSYKSHIGLIGGNVAILQRNATNINTQPGIDLKKTIGLISGNVSLLQKNITSINSNIGSIQGNVAILQRSIVQKSNQTYYNKPFKTVLSNNQSQYVNSITVLDDGIYMINVNVFYQNTSNVTMNLNLFNVSIIANGVLSTIGGNAIQTFLNKQGYSISGSCIINTKDVNTKIIQISCISQFTGGTLLTSGNMTIVKI
jgi:hypothetical protein